MVNKYYDIVIIILFLILVSFIWFNKVLFIVVNLCLFVWLVV